MWMDTGVFLKLVLRMIVYFIIMVAAIILGYFAFGTELVGFGVGLILGIHLLYLSWKYMKEAASDNHHESYPGQPLLLLAGSSEDRVRTISKITGIANVVLGLIFIGINFVALAHVPEALPNSSQEPEDFFSLLGSCRFSGCLAQHFFCLA